MDQSLFGSDRPLLYNVSPWAQLGFAVPNFGDNIGTVNSPIHNLAAEIARVQLFIMTHVDAQRTQFPSRNTVERLGKLCNRVQSVLVSRMRIPSDVRLESSHASANPRPWQIHPVPYFRSDIVANHWLREYNELCMIALTNIYQHSDNNLPLTITQQFAADIYAYFRELRRLLGTELLLLPLETVMGDDFMFTAEHYDAYDPSAVIVNTEAIQTPGAIFSRATEDDLRPLHRGIPANLIVTSLAQYPVDPAELGLSGRPLPGDAAAVGTVDGSAVARPGGTIGDPQL